MKVSTLKKPVILAVLFLLPVIFLLFLYPSTHNYNTLDIVHGPVTDIENLVMGQDDASDFKDNITVLMFLGRNPSDRAIGALNVKELVYDKFKGFKRFQVIALIGEDNSASLEELKKELYQYDELEYWSFIEANENETKTVFNGLLKKGVLNDDLSYEGIFIIDKDLMQRGRKDDREKAEISNNSEIYGLYSYNSIEVAELKNKISDDMRILFTEYRQKRKGNFNSSSRRVEDITSDEKN